MKKKLRELRRKKEFIKLCKGALQRNYVYGVFNRNSVFKRKGDKTRFKKGVKFMLLITLPKIINSYLNAKVKAKAKKRGGKNKIRG